MKVIHNSLSITAYILLVTTFLLSGTASAAGVVPDRYRAKQILSSMTLEAKVGQLFIVDLERLARQKNILELTPEIKQTLERYQVSGIILFAQNLKNKRQIIRLIKDIKSSETIPMFVCIDEEGGRVSRLEHTDLLKLEKLPSAEEIGKKNDSNYAYNVGETIAEQLKEFGFNVDFAPVVDINTNPENTVIGARSFGNTPEIVSKMGVEIIKGLQDNNIMSCAKHFPGHGDTSTDTHSALAYIEHDLQRLKNEEFIPFQAAIDNGVMSLMLAHIVAPKVTGDKLPATMSKTFVNILKKDMNFDGLIITDALMMKAISDNYKSADVCIKAIEAGVDILLMPDVIEEGINAVIEKAKNDKAFLNLVNNAVNRILIVKSRLNLYN